MARETANHIGTVVALNGRAWAMTRTGDRPLQTGDFVYKGESVVTGAGANLEIRFLDGTLLGQGSEARVDLDEYVLDDSGGSLDFQMVTGIVRLVSGTIADVNPEAFNLSTPLATIGIRGTEIIAKIDVNNQVVGVTDMSPGHYVVVATAAGEQRIEAPGLFSGIDENGFLIQVQPLSQEFVDAVKAVVPLTGMGESPRDPDSPDPEVPAPSDSSQSQEGVGGDPQQDGEPGDETGDNSDQGPDPVSTSPNNDPAFSPTPPSPPSSPTASGSISVAEAATGDEPESDGADDDDDTIDDGPEDTATVAQGEEWTDDTGNAAYHEGTEDEDTLAGLDGDDTLLGKGGDDSISGGDGTDLLEGGAGADTLTGGAGGDTFYYSDTAHGGDSITDFDTYSDDIGLDGTDDFSALDFDSGGTLSANSFTWYDNASYEGSGVSFGSGVTSGIVYASDSGDSSGKLYYEPDVNTAGDEVLLTDIVEYDDGFATDNNPDETDIKDVEDPGMS